MTIHLDGRHNVGQAARDVHELFLGYVRMLSGCVVHQQPPRQKPQDTDSPCAVEHVRPAKMFQYVSAERERKSHADRTAF